jgi:aminoglycoside phosphotransferase (APT) family kinase protein
VFKGTAHLNSVVLVPGNFCPVVVRRKVPNVSRREPRYLSEHVVLRAIQASGARVAAPRVLALGESYPSDPFAIHTYVGTHIDEPPSHPVNGLRPHEADALVDQLCELTGVEVAPVDPSAEGVDFYEWLAEQLVNLVRNLPKKSLQLARTLGLPDERRLREILSRHRLSRRAPVLLHGDLNPWNLVRRPDDLALTIIDWEMALIGDPLYDLVRHMHLTPTRPEIRERMFQRWERQLAAEYTKDWDRDWKVYRGIEMIRSAYIDLDRLATGASLDAPNVRRAVDSYAETLASATASLGLPVPAAANPYLARALA